MVEFEWRKQDCRSAYAAANGAASHVVTELVRRENVILLRQTREIF